MYHQRSGQEKYSKLSKFLNACSISARKSGVMIALKSSPTKRIFLRKEDWERTEFAIKYNATTEETFSFIYDQIQKDKAIVRSIERLAGITVSKKELRIT